MTIEEIRARQAEIRARLQEIDSEWANRSMSDEARSEWNALNEEFEANETLHSELVARRDRVENLAGGDENRERGADFQVPGAGRDSSTDIYDLSTIRSSVSGPEEATRQLRDRALRSIEQSQFPHPNADDDAVRAHIEHLLNTVETEDGQLARRLLATGSPVYSRAFGKALIGRPLSNEEQRALSLTDAAGGFAVPYTLDPTIIHTSDGAINPLRQIARVEQIVGDEWKGVSSAGITVSRAAEAAEASDDAPTLAQPSGKPTRVQGFIPFSIEAGANWPALQSEMATMLQDAKDLEEAESFTLGSGIGLNPEGIVTGLGAGSAVETATALTFAVGDLHKVKGALPPRFRSRASWLASDTIYSLARQFDTSGGASHWVDLNDDRPPRLIGKPAYEASEMSAVVAANELIAVYGDFNNYLIVDRLGMQVELIPHLFGANQRPTGQRGIYAIWLNTALILTDNAFRALKVKAT